MAPLSAVLCLALLGLTAATSYRYGSRYDSSASGSTSDGPRYGSTIKYLEPKSSSGQRASQPSSRYGAPKPRYGAPKYSSSYDTTSYGGPKPSSRYGAPHRPRLSGGSSGSFPQPTASGGFPQPTASGGFPQPPIGRPVKPPTFPSGRSGRPQPTSFSPRGSQGGSQFRTSWQEGLQPNFNRRQAAQACSERGMKLVSLTTPQKEAEINSLLSGGVEFYWTSGKRQQDGGFAWNDEPQESCPRAANCYKNWSPTGGDGRPQPDDRDGSENCLAVLINFYGDGIKWHDIGCHHLKHFVCE